MRHLDLDVKITDASGNTKETVVAGEYNRGNGMLEMKKMDANSSEGRNELDKTRNVGKPITDCGKIHAMLNAADSFKPVKYNWLWRNSNGAVHWLENRGHFSTVSIFGPWGTPGWRFFGLQQ